MKNFTRVMKALADANRVKIVKLLQHRTMCVCELQGVLGLAQPTVSKHLKILEEAGLVVSSKDGLWVNYAPSDGSSSPYVASLLGNLRHWLEDDPALRRAVPSIIIGDICINGNMVPGAPMVTGGRSGRGGVTH